MHIISTLRSAAAAVLLCISPEVATAQAGMQFPEASETVPELIDLWSESDAGCRLARREDVKVVAACLSRSVYGAALNERNWCLGRASEANAEMGWHECGADSLRFPPFVVPEDRL